jgi:transposase
MPKPYSLDLRERVVSYVEAGHSRRAAAAHFRVSPSFVINLMTAFASAARLRPRRSAAGDTASSTRSASSSYAA